MGAGRSAGPSCAERERSLISGSVPAGPHHYFAFCLRRDLDELLQDEEGGVEGGAGIVGGRAVVVGVVTVPRKKDKASL